MKIKDIALKNLWRRKTKAVFILSGLVIGVATVIGVMTFADTMTQDINHKLEKYGANILVTPKTDALTLSYGGVTMGGVSFEMQPIAQSSLAKIRTIKNAGNIAAVGPVVLGSVSLGGMPVLLTGVDFEVTSILKPWWKIDGQTPDEQGLLLGAEAARILNLQKGGHVDLMGQTMTVSGILESTGSQDDQLVFTRLDKAQALLGKENEISLVEVAALCKECPVEDMVSQISEIMPTANVMAIQQVVKGRMETLSQFRKFSYGLSIVVVLIGGLVVLVTLMGSVKERTREIGIFRAIGFRQRHVMTIIFLEAGLVSVLAGILGYGLGVGAIWTGIFLFGDHHMTSLALNPALAVIAMAMAVVVGLSASAYPAAMAARMDPNQALAAL